MNNSTFDGEILNLVKKKVYLIEEVIDKTWEDIDNVSLMTGLSGIPLFYAQMDRWTKSKKRLTKIYNIIEKVFDRINNGYFLPTYSSGIIGTAFMLNLLKKEKILNDASIDDSLLLFDDLIINKSLEDFEDFEHIDFLHGRLGAANYFLERPLANKTVENKVKDLFHKISDAVNTEVDKSKDVQDLLEFDDLTHKTNCGLAHGHISVILIFSKYLKLFPDDKQVLNSLRKSINILLSFKSDDPSTLALFPGIAVNKKTAVFDIPLGWCYGDQTIAFGLSEASNILNDKELSEIAYTIAKNTLKRDTFEISLSKLGDAGFCHGASSLAYMHKVFYTKYKDKKFNQLYRDFTSMVLDKGNGLEGLAGYRKYLGNNQFEDAIGLLDGIIGIGLFLLDVIMERDDQINWQSCFLLNPQNTDYSKSDLQVVI